MIKQLLSLRCYWRYIIVILATTLIPIGTLLLAWPKSSLISPEASVLLLDRQQQFLAQLNTHNQQGQAVGFGYWPIQNLPKRFVDATLALEDQHFYQHSGVDVKAVLRAFWQNLRNQRRISGASTIAMQVVRSQRPAARNYYNKAIEALAAIIMTQRYGRDAVLKQYLKIVPYANQIHGANYAARRYFNKTLEDLSWAEIAILSAIPQSPTRMNPLNYSGRQLAIKRGQRILQRLMSQGLIDSIQYQIALTQISQFKPPKPDQRPPSAMHAILHLEKKIADKQIQFDKQPAILISSFDLQLQQGSLEVLNEFLPWWRLNGASNAASIIIKRQDNTVLAWLGSGDYFDAKHLGAIDHTQIKRSAGSTLKPFVYALALDKQLINGTTVLDDLPDAQTLVRNSDYRYLGPLLPRQALANSRNVPVMTLTRLLGIHSIYSLFANLQLHHYQQDAEYYGSAMVLGSLAVTLEALATAYSTMSASGQYQSLRWFEQQPIQAKPIFSEQTSALINLYLSDPQARLPSFPRMGSSEYDFDTAVKTGTSQNYKDAWTVSYTQDYLVATWVGHADAIGMKNLSGSASAAAYNQQILNRLHPNIHQYPANFKPPTAFKPILLCTYSGLLASRLCPSKMQEWLGESQIPQQQDQSIKQLIIDKNTGDIATEDTKDSQKRLISWLDLPKRYDQWLMADKILSNNQQLDDGSNLSDQIKIDLSISAPKNNSRIIINPDLPEHANYLQLSARSSHRLPQLLWYIDDQPWQLSDFPYQANFKLIPGRYKIQVAVPLSPERSEPIWIEISH